MSELEQAKPKRIQLRTRSLTEPMLLEFKTFYEELQKLDPDLVVNYVQEVSEETKTFIQIDFYNEDDAQIGGFMCPYKE